MQHPNARLTPRGRRELVRLVEQGATLREAAAAYGVAVSTACVWAKRWRAAAIAEQASLACLHDRSSRPLASPRRCPASLEERICAARRETGWGPRLIAGVTGVAHQTVWKVLQRNGCSRRAERRVSRPIDTSGPVQVICCTWTSRATRGSSSRAMP